MVTINPKNEFIMTVQGIDGGRSFAVTLPKKFARHLGISVGDYVSITCTDSKIVIETLVLNHPRKMES